MNYIVIWSRRAENDLADAWLDAADREAVTDASAELDAGLADRPFRVGNPRGSTVRRYAVLPPLGIAFDIVEDDKKVIVQTCWLVG